MKILRPQLVLLFYDFPQVFIAEDQINGSYVCMLNEEKSTGPIFMCTPISSSRISKLTSGQVDLRTIFSEPELKEFLTAEFSRDLGDSLTITNISYENLAEDILPDSGLTFNSFDEVAMKASELNTTVSYVSLGVPEASESARIKSTTLATFLYIFQSAVKHFTRLSARTSKAHLKRDDDSFDADVFGFAHGSFTVKFRSSHDSDMFGENPTFSAALTQLNKFLSLASNPLDAVSFLQNIKGHTASSLIKLLAFLSENSASIKLEWATPSMASCEHTELSLESIRNLVEACRQRSDLVIEELVLTGRVSMADQKMGTWKIVSEADQETYSGMIPSGSDISLSGMIINDAIYQFSCEEIVEVTTATGRENRSLLLRAIKPL